MEITTPSTAAADAIADQWVALARDQRPHGSHLLPEDNRATVRETVSRHIVAGELLVARVDGDLAGFVSFTVESAGYEQDVERGIVENIYVVPEHRRRGIGSALLTAAEDRLEERGVDAVALEVMARNDAARRFYRRHGYEPHRVELEKSGESDTL